jgi:hypothetical protein
VLVSVSIFSLVPRVCAGVQGKDEFALVWVPGRPILVGSLGNVHKSILWSAVNNL